ncbi:MAG: hypothetical protein EPO11_02270 [Gammaproteobacteria bacterium]|nr:MAG: hypothetical protein EPO11_02270 [Gammaproteobacteria bacterium]
MSKIILQNHIALTASEDIKEICKPLERIGITYFSFVRSYKDGSHVRLSNNPEWTHHYYNREFYNVVLKQVPDAEGNILWSSVDRYPLFHEASELFNIDNGTVIVLTMEDVTERYFFGSTQLNKKVNYIYIHQIDLLKKFILYFKVTAEKLIKQAEKTKILVSKNKLYEQNSYNNNTLKEFLDDIKIDKVCVRVNGRDFYITTNEAKILSLTKYGYTAKEISKKIGLKQKTIEIYRDKLKAKLDLFTRGNLITLGNSNSLLDLILIK